MKLMGLLSTRLMPSLPLPLPLCRLVLLWGKRCRSLLFHSAIAFQLSAPNCLGDGSAHLPLPKPARMPRPSHIGYSTVHPISSKAEIWCVYFLSLLPAGRLVLVSILPSAGSLLLNLFTNNLCFQADGIHCTRYSILLSCLVAAEVTVTLPHCHVFSLLLRFFPWALG